MEYSALDLDLSILERRLVRRFGWFPRKARLGVASYKRFLHCCQIARGEGERLTPSEAVDEVWHYHVLDTRRYHEDCQRLFGQYLHHTPSDTKSAGGEYAENFARFMALYRKEFQEELRDWAWSWKDLVWKSSAI